MKENNRTVAIVQARMGSSRLPGKMMMKLGQYPLLFWVLHRVKKVNLIDSIVLATTQNKIDDPIVSQAEELSVGVFRGSESDVLERFVGAAEQENTKHIVRICADNPLVAPEEIDRLVRTHSTILGKGGNPERLYVLNTGPKLNNGYPDGLGGEMFSFQLLQKLDCLATQPLHREHISNFILDHPEDFFIHSIKAPKEIAFPLIKLDVDTKEDWGKLNTLCKHLNPDSSTGEVIATYKKTFL